mgnify:CR=1 FL=1
MLLQARHEDGESMSDAELRDELVTLLVAGHETTANALTWTWYLLSQNPAVEARFHEEIDSLVPSGAIGCCGMFSSFAALAMLPLPDAIALGYAVPRIVVALAGG